MKTVTFKDIILAFKDFADVHPQINDFDWGNISNIHTNEYNFPMIWLHPMNSINNGNLTILKFDMYVLDELEQDRTNLLDSMNNTMIIGNDVISKFWIDEVEELGFELDETKVSMIPFEGKFDNLLGCWIYTIEIQGIINLNECSIPNN